MKTRDVALAVLVGTLVVGCNSKGKQCTEALTRAKPLQEMLDNGLKKKKFSMSDFEAIKDKGGDFTPEDFELNSSWHEYMGSLYGEAVQLNLVVEHRKEMKDELKEDPGADMSMQQDWLKKFTTKLKADMKTTREHRTKVENYCEMRVADIEVDE